MPNLFVWSSLSKEKPEQLRISLPVNISMGYFIDSAVFTHCGAAAHLISTNGFSQATRWDSLDLDRAEGCIRISFATSMDNLKKAIERIGKAFS